MSSAAYHKPYYTPTNVCPTKAIVVQQDMPMTVNHINTVDDGPYSDIDIYVSTFLTSSVVTSTKVIIEHVTRTLEPVTHTKVKLMKTRLPVTITHVTSVTKVLTDTITVIVTDTATNYDTTFVTKLHSSAVYVETIWRGTFTSTVGTHTTTTVELSSFVITESPVITAEVTTRVPHTKQVYLTVMKNNGQEITHTFTKTLTRRACAKGYYH